MHTNWVVLASRRVSLPTLRQVTIVERGVRTATPSRATRISSIPEFKEDLMAYFVTGATGFIGRFLVANLLKREKPIYVLVRKSSQKKLSELCSHWGAA